MKKNKKTNNVHKDTLSDRDNYVNNRTNALEDYKNCLEEVKRDGPSVGGTICGLNFQQFSIIMIFKSILEQEMYCSDSVISKANYVDVEEEALILKQMIKDAKEVFKDDFDKFYEYYKEKQ